MNNASLPVQPTPTVPKAKLRPAGWKRFFSFLYNQVTKGCTNPVFVQYFIGIVVIAAGIGTWATIIRYFYSNFGPDEQSQEELAFRGILESAVTYAIAVSATALGDIILSATRGNSTPTVNNPFPRSVTLLCYILTIMVGVCLCVSFSAPLRRVPAIAAVSAVLLGLCQYWIINAGNSALQDDDDPSDYTGGDPLGQLSGDVKGFKT